MKNVSLPFKCCNIMEEVKNFCYVKLSLGGWKQVVIIMTSYRGNDTKNVY